MPFSLADELMGYWMFGEVYCEIHAAVDVLLCTASIMNICLIALDRYWSITRAIDYLNARTPAKVTIMIITVWILSGLISIPPLLGWKQDQDLTWFTQILVEQGNRTQMEFIQDLQDSGRMNMENFTSTLELVVYPQCGLSQDLGYVLYSAFGSFYIPSCIMVFVYIKIYYAARDRARRNITNKHKKRDKTAKSKEREKRTKHGNTNGNLIPLISHPNGKNESNNGEPPTDKNAVSTISSNNKGETNKLSSTEVHLPLPCGACSSVGGTKHRRSVGVSTYEDNETATAGNSPKVQKEAVPMTLARFVVSNSPQSISKPRILLGSKRRSSKEARQVIDTGKARILKSSSKRRLREKRKELQGRKRDGQPSFWGLSWEASLPVGFPFFFLYSISPICPICEEAEGLDRSESIQQSDGCCVMGWGFSFAFWMGYSNSALNPVIYTVFNQDFRRAFKRILFK
ncbi:Octalpha [Lepeophtheirus salmonis]|uniref:Octalpha n=1 Tax=Lepeophtheirus salmonis TaxID=72036 RepID=A0A7R8CNU6_LEPSM|nr:Octalpha [Lepeophtheirus salmonis]CAF2876273.1 Octalpha [Lepeophtheirus salmonis]